jgi:hypothetical protein
MTSVLVVGIAAASSARAGKIPRLKVAMLMTRLNCFTFMVPVQRKLQPGASMYSLKAVEIQIGHHPPPSLLASTRPVVA